MSISNMDDVIDSRDVIARIEELEAIVSQDDIDNLIESDEASELVSLRELAEKASGYAADWRYGKTLIRDYYFRDYAEQLAEDIGAINSDARWPNNCIDWERAARELRMDYMSVDFDGIIYLIR